jgi:hypothetical protein
MKDALKQKHEESTYNIPVALTISLLTARWDTKFTLSCDSHFWTLLSLVSVFPKALRTSTCYKEEQCYRNIHVP